MSQLAMMIPQWLYLSNMFIFKDYYNESLASFLAKRTKFQPHLIIMFFFQEGDSNIYHQE